MNADWRNNPKEIRIKTSEVAETQSIGIEKIQEFGIGDAVKFERHTVMIDWSSDRLSELSHERVPQLTEARLFLKVLLEGPATLYQFEAGNVRRFYYRVGDADPEVKPLIYKRYKVSNTSVGANNQFRQQLLNDLKCQKLSASTTARMEYKPDPLIRYFSGYNSCAKGNQITFENPLKKGGIHVAARVGLSHAMASIAQDPSEPFPGAREVDVDFEGKYYPRFGMEIELVMPFGGDKWSVFLDPSYQQYMSDARFVRRLNGNDIETQSTLTYKTIEVPFGVRHYFFLNEASQLFMNISFALVFNSNSNINFETQSPFEINDLTIEGTEDYFSLGIGYRFHKRVSLEGRYNTGRDLLASDQNWTSKYDGSYSFILGYRFL